MGKLYSISATDCALGSLRDLGYPDSYITGGDIRHDISSSMVGLMSKIPLVQYVMALIFTKVIKN